MPIEPNPPPPAVTAAVHEALADPPGKHTFFASLLAAKGPTRFLSIPHRVAYLGLDDIRANVELRQAVQYESWRFLVHEGTQMPALDASGGFALVGAATVHTASNSYCGLSKGRFAEGTEEAIRKAESLPRVRNGSFEAILLVAPSVYVTGLWLRDLKNNDDFILPIPPVSPPLGDYEETPPAAFLAALDGLAKKVRGG